MDRKLKNKQMEKNGTGKKQDRKEWYKNKHKNEAAPERRQRESVNLKLLHGWMTHLPTAFWRSFSFNRAFLLPNSFIASLLSDGWNRAISWSRRSLAKFAGFVTVGLSSSFGVPYRLISSPTVQSCETVSILSRAGQSND